MLSGERALLSLSLRLGYAVLFYFITVFLLRLTVHPSATLDQRLTLAVTVFPTAFLLFRLAQVPSLYTPTGPIFTRFFPPNAWPVFRFAVGMFLGGRLALHAGVSPPIGWIVGGPLIFLLPSLFRPRAAPLFREFLRGTQLLSPDEAYYRSKQLPTNGRPPIFWGGLSLPDSVSEGHFLVVGATGSGKTLTLRLLMQSVLPRIRPGSQTRALVYDAKQDMLSLLHGMGVDAPIVILNPFDARSVAWDMAQDVDSPAAALQVANIFIEEERGQNAFFSKAARGLLGNVLKAFTLAAPRRWTLADVVYVLKDKDRIRSLLTSVPQTTDAYKDYFGRNTKTVADIELTIKANIEMLEPIAALWAHSRTRISLRDWFKSEYVLVLGRDEELKAPLDALNRVIFSRLAQRALKQPPTPYPQTWFFIDELREAGKLEGLNGIVVEGRSRGIRVALGFQDIDGLREVYENFAANEIAGLCANKSLLRLDSESTAKWASGLLGEAEVREYTKTKTKSTAKNPTGSGDRHSESSTKAEHIVKREAALASELMRLPPVPTTPPVFFSGYHIMPALGVYVGDVEFEAILRPPASVPNFVERDVMEQYLPEGLGVAPEPAALAEAIEPEQLPDPPRSTLDDIETLTLDDLEQEPGPE